MQQDGVTFFRASELAHSVGQSEGWKGQEKRRRRLQSDLMELVVANAYRKFGCVLDNSKMGQIPDAVKEHYYINAYSLAGRTCVSDVARWKKVEKITAPTEFVFEDGDVGKEELRKRMVEDAHPEPIFRPKKDETNPDSSIRRQAFVPLQAADWLAYEYFLALKHVVYEKKQNYELRWGIEQFERIPGPVGTFLDSDFEALNLGLRVSAETMFLTRLIP